MSLVSSKYEEWSAEVWATKIIGDRPVDGREYHLNNLRVFWAYHRDTEGNYSLDAPVFDYDTLARQATPTYQFDPQVYSRAVGRRSRQIQELAFSIRLLGPRREVQLENATSSAEQAGTSSEVGVSGSGVSASAGGSSSREQGRSQSLGTSQTHHQQATLARRYLVNQLGCHQMAGTARNFPAGFEISAVVDGRVQRYRIRMKNERRRLISENQHSSLDRLRHVRTTRMA
jgi:hypothetical protein